MGLCPTMAPSTPFVQRPGFACRINQLPARKNWPCPEKPAGACLAVDESTRLAMSLAKQRECEPTMRTWYGETWYSQPDPADCYDGDAQFEYLRAKALGCRRAADTYHVTGKDRWTVLMRCLVIVRKG